MSLAKRNMLPLNLLVVISGITHAEPRTAVKYSGASAAWAGVGEASTRASESLESNPANLVLVKQTEVAAMLSNFSVDYSYEYPDEPAVKINKSEMVPHIGGAHRLPNGVVVGAFYLPVPEDAREVELNRVPTRELSSDPVSVRVEQTGDGMGHRLGVGAGYALGDGVAIGASLLYEREGLVREVYERLLGIKLRETKLRITDTKLNLGMRWVFDSQTNIYVSTILWGRVESIGTQSSFGLFGAAEDKIDEVERHPLNFDFAVEREFSDKLTSIGFLSWHGWEGEFDGDEIDAKDTIDFMAGLRYLLADQSQFNCALSHFSTRRGDGKIAASNGLDGTIAGLQIGELDELPLSAFSIGYGRVFRQTRVRAFWMHQWSDHDVGDDGVARGKHELSSNQIGISGVYTF
jgi:hypothetical protein